MYRRRGLEEDMMRVELYELCEKLIKECGEIIQSVAKIKDKKNDYL